MNLEMPSAGEIQHLRTILVIVLGIMVVTIPVVAILVIAKVRAQQRQGSPPRAKAPGKTIPPSNSTDEAASGSPDQ